MPVTPSPAPSNALTDAEVDAFVATHTPKAEGAVGSIGTELHAGVLNLSNFGLTEAAGVARMGDVLSHRLFGADEHAAEDPIFKRMTENDAEVAALESSPRTLGGKIAGVGADIVGTVAKALLSPEITAAQTGVNTTEKLAAQGEKLSKAFELGGLSAGLTELGFKAGAVGSKLLTKTITGGAAGAALPLAGHLVGHQIDPHISPFPSAESELASTLLFAVTPGAFAALHALRVGVGNVLPSDTPREVTEEALARAQQVAPDAVKVAEKMDAEAKASEKPVPQAAPRSVDEVLDRRGPNRPTQKKWDEMSPAEQKQAHMTDSLTGLPNGSALTEAAPFKYYAKVDADSLKFANDSYGEHGPDSGDALIQDIGTHLGQEFNQPNSLHAFRSHTAGDEFIVGSDASEADLDTRLKKVAAKLANIHYSDGRSPRITWGTGDSTERADAVMRGQKVRREAMGLRAKRGEKPPDYVGQEEWARSRPDDPEIEQLIQNEQDQAVGWLSEPDAQVGEQAAVAAGKSQTTESVQEPDFEALLKEARKGRLRKGLVHIGNVVRGDFRRTFPQSGAAQEYAGALLTQVMSSNRMNELVENFKHKQRYKILARLSEGNRLRFVTDLQKGRVSRFHPELARYYRDANNEMYRVEASNHIGYDYRQNYFPQYFQRPADYSAWKIEQDKKTTVVGKQAFQHNREFEDIGEALQAKFLPIDTNPEFLHWTRRLMHFKIMGQYEAMRAMVDHGFMRAGTHPEPGELSIKMPDDSVWIGPERIVRMMKNGFFNKALFDSNTVGGMVWKAYMEGKQAITGIMLGPSLFHGVNVAYALPTHAMAEAAHAWMDLDPSERYTAKSLKILAKQFLRPVTAGSFRNANEFKKAVAGKVPMTPAMAEYIKRVIAGGFQPGISREYTMLIGDKILQAWQEKNLRAMAAHALPALGRALQWPISNYFVPQVKLMAYLEGTDRLIEQNPALAQPGKEQTLAFSRLRKNIDLRIGQMAYNSLFWNQMVSHLMQATFLSFTWNYSFINQYGGSGVDIARMVRRQLPGDKAERYLGSRTAYATLSMGTAMLLNGLTGYVLSGKLPEKMKDWWYPQGPDGKRLTTPFMVTREFGGLYYHMRDQGPITGPAVMAKNKIAPILSMIHSMFTNENYFNQQIADPEDPFYQRFGEHARAAFISMLPLSVQAYESGQTRGKEGAALAVLGIMPAPAYVTKAPLVEKIYTLADIYNQSMTPAEEVPQIEARHQLRQLYAASDYEGFAKQLGMDAEKFGWSKAQVMGFAKELNAPEGAYELQHDVPERAQEDLMDNEMTREQVMAYLPYFSPQARLHYFEKHP